MATTMGERIVMWTKNKRYTMEHIVQIVLQVVQENVWEYIYERSDYLIARRCLGSGCVPGKSYEK
jgi:hypothetical protein